MAWLAQYRYRTQFSVSRSAGAVSNYQIKLTITTGDLNYHCLESFNDLRFTNSVDSILNYWIESITGTSPNLTATVWVKCDSIGTSDTLFYLYYGNLNAPFFSNGDNTFDYFLNKNSTSDWTGSSGIVISTDGDFLNFYYGSSGYAYKQKYMSSSYQKRTTWLQMKNTDISNNEIDIGFKNNTLNCGLIKIGTVASGGQSHWYTADYDSEFEAGSWTEGTEYKFKLSFDETTSGTSIYQYNLSDQLLASQTDLTFPYGDLLPTLSSGISVSSDYPFSYSLRYLFTTELLTSEPSVGSFGAEELPFVGLASDRDYRDGDSKVNKMYLGTAIIYTRKPQFTIASGGNISYYGDYKIHTFLSSGNFIVTYEEDYDYSIEYLIVAGGGGGGAALVSYCASGGGGAGGVVSGSFSSLSRGAYTVVVGSGGAEDTNGSNSTFNSQIAYGGGRGGNTSHVGGNGGCGGGGGASRYSGSKGPGTGSQGYNGGNYYYSSYYYVGIGGGGGGMGEIGQNAAQSVPGRGGNGITSSITGSSVYYGGGGAGSQELGPGTGGLGGGGGASNINGASNTGGGGAGGRSGGTGNTAPGGTGGSGIVIIRYRYK